MIGKGKSISHTKASLAYGWNQEKEAEVVYSQHLAGENPQEITEEFGIIQEQNTRCQKNTLSFVISPTIEDGKKLNKQKLKELTQQFIKQMGLKERQAIAFVHRDKQHTHIHLYVNRIDFNGKAYNDSFIGKRSQHAAQEVARAMDLTTVREIQQEKQLETIQTRIKIKEIHEEVMKEHKPKDFDQYIHHMNRKKVQVIPSINRSGKLQGFRFEFKGENFKGSEVHRSISGGRLAVQLSGNSLDRDIAKDATINILGKTLEFSTNLAASMAKRAIKTVIRKAIDQGIGI